MEGGGELFRHRTRLNEQPVHHWYQNLQHSNDVTLHPVSSAGSRFRQTFASFHKMENRTGEEGGGTWGKRGKQNGTILPFATGTKQGCDDTGPQ